MYSISIPKKHFWRAQKVSFQPSATNRTRTTGFSVFLAEVEQCRVAEGLFSAEGPKVGGKFQWKKKAYPKDQLRPSNGRVNEPVVRRGWVLNSQFWGVRILRASERRSCFQMMLFFFSLFENWIKLDCFQLPDSAVRCPA